MSRPDAFEFLTESDRLSRNEIRNLRSSDWAGMHNGWFSYLLGLSMQIALIVVLFEEFGIVLKVFAIQYRRFVLYLRFVWTEQASTIITCELKLCRLFLFLFGRPSGELETLLSLNEVQLRRFVAHYLRLSFGICLSVAHYLRLSFGICVSLCLFLSLCLLLSLFLLLSFGIFRFIRIS